LRTSLTILAAAAAATMVVSAAPASAEILAADEDHFVTRAEAVVEADPKATWLALISPARWWSSEHTWSGDAANLTLTPQAGGCYCEKIPEVNEPDRFTLEGSVEHMRVIQAYPESALRMVGALGPLQSEPVTGILTIALSEVEIEGGMGTRIVFEYNVGGQMRYPVQAIAPAVDGVLTQQLTSLADLLGTVEGPAAPTPPPPVGEPEAAPPPDEGEPEDEAIAIDAEAVIDEEPEPSAVDEAFDDLSDGG